MVEHYTPPCWIQPNLQILEIKLDQIQATLSEHINNMHDFAFSNILGLPTADVLLVQNIYLTGQHIAITPNLPTAFLISPKFPTSTRQQHCI